MGIRVRWPVQLGRVRMSDEQNTTTADDIERIWTALRGTDRTIRRIFISGGAWSMAWIILNVIGFHLLSDLVLGLGMAGLVLVGSLGMVFEVDERRREAGPGYGAGGVDE
jgi:hypothetical protein